MPIKRKPLTKDFFDQFFVLNNVFLVFSIFLFIIYLILSLFDFKSSIRSLMCYGSWVLMAVVMRIILKRLRKALRLRGYDYPIMCFVAMAYSYREWTENKGQEAQ